MEVKPIKLTKTYIKQIVDSEHAKHSLLVIEDEEKSYFTNGDILVDTRLLAKETLKAIPYKKSENNNTHKQIISNYFNIGLEECKDFTLEEIKAMPLCNTAKHTQFVVLGNVYMRDYSKTHGYMLKSMGINTKYLPLFEQIVKDNPNFKLRYVIDKGHLAHNTLIIADENNNSYGLIMIVMGNENADVDTIE